MLPAELQSELHVARTELDSAKRVRTLTDVLQDDTQKVVARSGNRLHVVQVSFQTSVTTLRAVGRFKRLSATYRRNKEAKQGVEAQTSDHQQFVETRSEGQQGSTGAAVHTPRNQEEQLLVTKVAAVKRVRAAIADKRWQELEQVLLNVQQEIGEEVIQVSHR